SRALRAAPSRAPGAGLRVPSSTPRRRCARRSDARRASRGSSLHSRPSRAEDRVRSPARLYPAIGRFSRMAHKVVLIPGDGTGPELTEATRRALEATGVEFDWDVREAGADVMDSYGGNPLPPEVLDAVRE